MQYFNKIQQYPIQLILMIEDSPQKPACPYSDLICMDMIISQRCQFGHTPQNIQLMKQKFQKIQRQHHKDLVKCYDNIGSHCKYGYKCFRLLRGQQCVKQHSYFDFKFVFKLRRRLRYIQCPQSNNCNNKHCYYSHQKQLHLQNQIEKYLKDRANDLKKTAGTNFRRIKKQSKMIDPSQAIYDSAGQVMEDKVCQYSKHICFRQLYYGQCRHRHTQTNIHQMKMRLADIKHQQKRKLELTIEQPKSRDCPLGIHCHYIIKGICRHHHCYFDAQLALNVRKKLLEINCPRGIECDYFYCFYRHSHQKRNLAPIQDVQRIAESRRIQEGFKTKRNESKVDVKKENESQLYDFKWIAGGKYELKESDQQGQIKF